MEKNNQKYQDMEIRYANKSQYEEGETDQSKMPKQQVKRSKIKNQRNDIIFRSEHIKQMITKDLWKLEYKENIKTK